MKSEYSERGDDSLELIKGLWDDLLMAGSVTDEAASDAAQVLADAAHQLEDIVMDLEDDDEEAEDDA